MKKGYGYVSIDAWLNEGDKLRPSIREHDKIELFMEKIRKKDFPDKPSRLNAYFLAPDWHSAKAWRKLLDSKTHTYLVKYKGNDLLADGDLYTEVYFKVVNSHPSIAKSYTEQYWQGMMVSNLKEIVVAKDGEVEIIREVDLDKSEEEESGMVLEKSKFRRFIRRRDDVLF